MKMQRHLLKVIFAVCVLSLGILATGCTSSTYETKRGAAYGAGAGAILGGIIGHQSGRGLEGAAIGAGAGALFGGALGSARDEQRDRNTSYGDARYRTYYP